MDFKYACRTCGNRGKTNDNQDACAKFKIKIDLSKDGCSWHTNEFITCAICGRQYNPNEVTAYITDTMEVCYVCKNCYSQFHTCGTCEIYPKCGFSEDRTEPQVVTKTIRQGFMTMQTQVNVIVLLVNVLGMQTGIVSAKMKLGLIVLIGNYENHCSNDIAA